MVEYCPACGSEMELSTARFAMSQSDGAPVVCGVPHFACPECGQIKFTHDQLHELHAYRKAQRAAAEKKGLFGKIFG